MRLLQQTAGRSWWARIIAASAVMLTLGTLGWVIFVGGVTIGRPALPGQSARPAPYPPAGWHLAIDDPMTEGTSVVFPDEYAGGRCGFSSAGFYISPPANTSYPCGSVPGVFADVVVEIESPEPDKWVGVMIRTGDRKGYLALAGTTPRDSGRCSLSVFNNDGGRTLTTFPHHQWKPVLLAVRAVGDEISVFCDHVLLTSVTDATAAKGGITLAAGAATPGRTTTITRLRVWTPPTGG